MTLKQFNHHLSEWKRLIHAYNSLMTSRNTIAMLFNEEYSRHLKLHFKVTTDKLTNEIVIIPKKETSKSDLIFSLSKSRNMKRIQKEMADNKARVIQNQKECKEAKKIYRKAEREYQKNLVKKDKKFNYA